MPSGAAAVGGDHYADRRHEGPRTFSSRQSRTSIRLRSRDTINTRTDTDTVDKAEKDLSEYKNLKDSKDSKDKKDKDR